MSTGKLSSGCGQRLKEERDRLGFSQKELGALMGGAGEKTVRNWEGGASAPDAVQLAALLAAGGDVLYVISGVRSPLRTGEPAPGDREESTASQRAANRIALLSLTDVDGDFVVALARRLAGGVIRTVHDDHSRTIFPLPADADGRKSPGDIERRTAATDRRYPHKPLG